jgi:hypothetical protein
MQSAQKSSKEKSIFVVSGFLIIESATDAVLPMDLEARNDVRSLVDFSDRRRALKSHFCSGD